MSFVATVTTMTIGVGPGWIRARNPAGFEAGHGAIETECRAAHRRAALSLILHRFSRENLVNLAGHRGAALLNGRRSGGLPDLVPGA